MAAGAASSNEGACPLGRGAGLTVTTIPEEALTPGTTREAAAAVTSEVVEEVSGAVETEVVEETEAAPETAQLDEVAALVAEDMETGAGSAAEEGREEDREAARATEDPVTEEVPPEGPAGAALLRGDPGHSPHNVRLL